MRVEITISVPQDLEATFEQYQDAVTAAVKPAMVEQIEKVRARSMEIVPVDQGILRNSALANGTNLTESGHDVSVRIGYGGAARSYALTQHETPPSVFSHAPGKSWKYLERPLLEAIPEIREALTGAVAAALTSAGPVAGPTFGEGE